MDVLARIPELPQPRRAATVRGGDGPVNAVLWEPALPASGAAPRLPRRWPRVPTGSVTTLALVAAAIWTLVAWRERQEARAARAAVRLAEQHDTTTTVERAR